MKLLGIDVGSSSVKAAVLHEGRVCGQIAKATFVTRYANQRAEVSATAVLAAVAKAIGELGSAAKQVQAIALANMAPSWVAMDARGKALTPIVTHQDRRSVQIAGELEAKLGKQRILRLAGNRPFPGGISSTTAAWFCRHEPAVMRKADLVGHVNTFLLRQLTGTRVTDPSNASFMGLYRTTNLGGWSQELCEAVGVSARLLPQIIQADQIAGHLTRAAAGRLGLVQGTPMLPGMIDTGAALLLAGAKVGQLLNVSGSTDVLALCTDKPQPHERLLTRALGIGRRWMSVSTLAAAGSSLQWASEQLFADWPSERFWQFVGKLARQPRLAGTSIRFEPYLAGDRMSIEQRQGAFVGLTLSSTRQQMLGAILEALAAASAARLPLLIGGGVRVSHQVLVSGGVQHGLARVLHRDWPGRWEFRGEQEATLRGLGTLVPRITDAAGNSHGSARPQPVARASRPC